MHDYSQDLQQLLSIPGIIQLFTLSVLEIVLGIDNIIFISIIADRLPKVNQQKARRIGLVLALVVRCCLLFSINWITSLIEPLFHIGIYGVSGRGLILFGGGIFLLYKTWKEIMEKVNGIDHEMSAKKGVDSFKSVVIQIVLIDIVFSFDSILTAVAISNNILIMVGAVTVSMILMILFSGMVAEFINRNPGIKMIALTFLLAIGGILLAESIVDSYNSTVSLSHHVEVNKNYAYVALLFAMIIEFFNMWERKVKRQKDFKQED
jgi:predicted tellurium resistance membrane protein TerC